MIEPKSRELQAVRIEVAINICIKYPTLYNKIQSGNLIYKSNDEMVACHVLLEMLRLEPCIKNILSFYYKRELR